MSRAVVSASSPTKTISSIQFRQPFPPPRTLNLSTSDLSLRFSRTRLRLQRPPPPRSSTGPGAPNSGDDESRDILDAFFLGKALAEALNERIESTVGEFLSTVGRLQAEQQKQVQEFQNEVLERAKKAKEKAAREAMEGQGGLVPKSDAAITTTTSATNGASYVVRTSPTNSSSGTDEDPVDVEPVQ